MRRELEIPADAFPGRFGVYTLFSGVDECLYIGQTRNLLERLKSHRSQKPWWKQVRRLEWAPCDGPNEARALEKGLIEAFRPEHNAMDVLPLPRQSRQIVPDWMAAKLIELHEAESVAGPRHNVVERDRLNCYLAALRQAGWRLEPLGLPMNMSRERVRQRVLVAPSASTSFGVVAPPITRKPKPVKVQRPQIPASALPELLELQALARRVNGPTPLDSPLREASLRYTELLAEWHINGVGISRIAKQMGVTPMAIRARLARHGYIEEVKGLPANVAYGARVWSRYNQTHCKWGHELAGDNLRTLSTDPTRRICKACERRRASEYKARKASA